MTRVDELIQFYGLIPHPEGGYFKETYRSSEITQTPSGKRPVSTAIIYLLCQGQASKLHRIKSDEMWHFYEGDPLVVFEKNEDGLIQETVLGRDFLKGQRVQYTVPASKWFGAYLPEGSLYSLVGCTVAPGFDFKDFELE